MPWAPGTPHPPPGKPIIDAIAPDAVRADLLSVVQRFLEPTHDAPWIRQIR
jgi:hypothetical protein